MLLDVISRLLGETIPHHFASVTLWDEHARQLRRHALVFPDGRGVVEKACLLRSVKAPPRIAFDSGKTMVFQVADVEAFDDFSGAS